MDEGAKDTRDIFDVFVECLNGADRVVIETKNALGCMDAHYLHAPEILKAIEAKRSKFMEADNGPQG